MATFNSNQPWVPTNTGLYELAQEKSNSITCLAGGEEMLRVGPDGFWVRGVKVPQDDKEAEIVYNAFKEWMTWAQLTRE